MPRRQALLAAFLLAFLAACPDEPQPLPEDEGLHVASPDWRDQVIYFVMTDRFANGDPANDDQGEGEFDPADDRKYSGGDLQGVLDQLDYIQGLGATALWITPPVANQWWDPMAQYGGYHGYWARDFKAVDAHLGTLETYKALSKALHARGMYLVQDIVTNHTGNFFEYDPAAWDPSDPTAGYVRNTASRPSAAPTQTPFDQNDATSAAHRDAAIYHWTPAISDYQDPDQELTYQLSSLDDLNTGTPAVRTALKDSYAHWIREVGVDAFRIDTVIYVEHDFWHDFVHAPDGIEAAAAQTGRDDFLTFGEAFVSSDPLDDTGDRKVAAYLGTAEKPELSSVLNFPLYFTMRRVFAEGSPTQNLTYRLETTQALYPDPARLPVFVENHDVGRFLSRGTEAGLKQALTFLLTTPGIPVLYYGTEQLFSDTRASMFAEGWGSGGTDHFKTSWPMYNFMKTAVALRRDNPVFSRGTLQVLRDSPGGPGVFVYERSYEGARVLVVMNTADEAALLADLDASLPEGAVLERLFGLRSQEGLVAGPGGRLTAELGIREALVLRVTGETQSVPAPGVVLTLDTDLSAATVTGDVALQGTAVPRVADVRVVIDGLLGSAIPATVAADGTFTVTVPGWRFGPGLQTHTLSLYSPSQGVATAPLAFQTDIARTGPLVEVVDPEGDDTGPAGSYTLPTDPSFGDQMDLRRVSAALYGNTLVVEAEMGEITKVWNPANGFDHVAFHVFVDLPDVEGTPIMPRLNAQTPEGFAWDYMAFVEGWNASLYASAGADAVSPGTPATPVPALSTSGSTVRFVFTPQSLGNPATLSGARIYVTTWDYDGVEGRLRPLTPEGGPYAFGGGDGTTDPLILDDSEVLVYP